MKAVSIFLVISLLCVYFLPFFTPAQTEIDLGIAWIKVEKDVVSEGEVVKIKAKVENLSGNIPPFVVSFYYDAVDKKHLIGKRYYYSINFYRLPSIEWDTKGLVGRHNVIACISPNDLNSENNIANTSIEIINTSPDKNEKKILITELYYHAHPNIKNEYVCIHNPTSKKINISWWYITIEPWKRVDKQRKVIFPQMFLQKNESIYVTQNASAFYLETGKMPDFEYYDSCSIPDLEREGYFILSNKGGVVCLKDEYNHTIDVVVYGNKTWNEGWEGKGIRLVNAGIVLKRKWDGGYIDTNKSSDWNWNRTYRIGQTDFSPFSLKFKGNATVFCSPDCSFETISSEIKKAKHSIYINMYQFTNPQIYHELEEALERNVSLNLLLEGNPVGGLSFEERYIATMLHKKGGKIWYMYGKEKTYRRYVFNHAKYAIFDNKTVVIESANWVKSGVPEDATYGNREWGIVIKNESIAKFLLNVFEKDCNKIMQDVVPFNASHFIYGSPPSYFTFDESIPHGEYIPSFPPKTINGTFNVTVILSPDNAENEMKRFISSAKKSIFVEQAYIEKDWDSTNPFLNAIVKKNESGVEVKVLLNYNPEYESTNEMNEETYAYLKEKGIDVKFFYTNSSPLKNIHNKGIIVDGEGVLISSINFNENSVRNNREVGIIIKNEDVAEYFTNVFKYDWNAEFREKGAVMDKEKIEMVLIGIIFGLAFLIIYIHWRR